VGRAFHLAGAAAVAEGEREEDGVARGGYSNVLADGTDVA